MGRKQVHLMLDEYTWTQFQALYPRQATKSFEDMMKAMINLKLEISDEQYEILKQERDQIKQTADELLDKLKEREVKLQAYQAKKREEVLAERNQSDKEWKAKTAIMDASRAAGIHRRGLI